MKCVRSIVLATPSPVEYFINEAAIPIAPSPTLDPSDCTDELVYTITKSDNTALPGPTISYNSATRVITVYETDWNAV